MVSGRIEGGISGCFSEKVLGCAPHPWGVFYGALERWSLHCHLILCLYFFFPKLSVLLSVKQVASYVKVELNLRQDSQG